MRPYATAAVHYAVGDRRATNLDFGISLAAANVRARSGHPGQPVPNYYCEYPVKPVRRAGGEPGDPVRVISCRLAAVREPETAPAEQLDNDFYQHPLAYFARMREEGPVTPVLMPYGDRVWMVTRYADVRAALADPRLYKDWAGKLAGPDWVPNEVTSYLSAHLLNADPPDHTRLRKLVTKAFTSRRVAGLRPRVEAITASLLDAVAARFAAGEAVDLIEAFAFPLPVTVICELLGVPARDQDQFREWSHATVTSEPGAFRGAGAAIFRYFTTLVAAKRTALADGTGPADDMVSALIDARDSGDSLDERELIAMLFLLLIAGHETTTNLIASGTLALLASPGEFARLRADPSLLPGATEELLRYANPLNHATERFTLEPVEIGGVTIPAREWVVLATSSANHDPGRFPGADRLDVGRDAGGHMAFGHGIHYCLGAPLARLEGEVAFGALLSRFPGLSLAADPSSLRWRRSSLIHGLETLPVRLR
jgi:cytochrome P450